MLFILTLCWPFPSRSQHYPRTGTKEITRVLAPLTERWGAWLQEQDTYAFQLIYTQIDRDANNRPTLYHYSWNLDTNRYFLPASFVKLPVAALALEEIQAIREEDRNYALNSFSPMRVAVGRKDDCQTPTTPTEASEILGYPSVAHNVKAALVGSDNTGYDRLFEFLGQCEINRRLRAKGYTTATIISRYGKRCSKTEDLFANPVQFFLGDSVIHALPARRCAEIFYHRRSKNAPNGYPDSPRGTYISLWDAHQMLLAVMLPQAMPAHKRFHLSGYQYKLLRKYLGMYAAESYDPVFPKKYTQPVTALKFLFYGGGLEPPRDSLRVFNKVGFTRNFVTDVAYVVDFENDIEFALSATLFLPGKNATQRAKPFFRDLGQAFYSQETTRWRLFRPELDYLKFNYTVY